MNDFPTSTELREHDVEIDKARRAMTGHWRVQHDPTGGYDFMFGSYDIYDGERRLFGLDVGNFDDAENDQTTSAEAEAIAREIVALHNGTIILLQESR